MGGKNSKPDSSKIIDGKAVAADIRAEIRAEVAQMKEKYGKVPGLAVVIVGSRPDSATYVRMKRKACDEVGITSFHKELPETATEDELLKVVKDFNADPACHGYLVQLPLPKHMNEEKALAAISLEKDVDGFHLFEHRRARPEGPRAPVHAVHPQGLHRAPRARRRGAGWEERRRRRQIQHRRRSRRADADEEELHRHGRALADEKPHASAARRTSSTLPPRVRRTW